MASAGLSNGFDFRISVADTRFYSILGNLIVEDLSKININVEIDRLPFHEFVYNNENNPPSAYVSVILSPSTVTHIDAVFVDLFLFEPLLGTYRFNHMRNQHIEIISAMSRLSSVHENDPRRLALLIELSELIHDEAVVIPIFRHTNLHVLNRKFRFDVSENYLFTCIQMR